VNGNGWVRDPAGQQTRSNKAKGLETIMSTLTSTTEHLGANSTAATAIVGALKRCWVAYITWRLERAGIASLRSMSERELSDLGIARSEIEEAVKGWWRRDARA
jgi:uncharacterized protein YjiS (DUF1127 family)